MAKRIEKDIPLPNGDLVIVARDDGTDQGSIPGVDISIRTKESTFKETRNPTPEEWRDIRERVHDELDALYSA